MIYLLLSIFSSVLIAVVIRINEHNNLNRFGVMFINYLTASLLGFIFLMMDNSQFRIMDILPLSFLTGFLFVTTFIVFMISVRHWGLAVPVTVTRISVVIPVLGSILIYSEYLNYFQIGGLILAIIAIYLFSTKPAGSKTDINTSKWYLPAILFLMMGFVDFSLKIFQESFAVHRTMNFILMVFFIASIYTAILVTVKKVKINYKIMLGGILLGIPNFTSAIFFIMALRRFPGAVAFPVNSIGIILLSVIIGIIFWKELLLKRIYIAICLSIIAIFLLNYIPSR